MKFIIDRFEGEIAVIELENGDIIEIPKIILPDNASEGTVINISCDDEETNKKKDAVKKKMNSIFRS